MNMGAHLMLWLIVGLIVVFVGAPILYRWLNPENRESRKRRRNYGKIVPRVKRPMVILNAKTGDEEKARKPANR